MRTLHRLNTMKSSSYSKGFSLLEFLVAGLLGLILLAGVIQLFLGSNRSYTMQDELATIQENGRFSLMFLKGQLQQAGWFVNSNLQADRELPINFGASLDDTNDTIAINYSAAVNGVDNVDCTGSVVADGNIINTFSVVNEELVCQGNGGGVAQPLIDGVERFQILYGVLYGGGQCPTDLDHNYLNRNDVIAGNLQNNVISVRVGVLLKSDGDVLPEADSKSFTVLNVTYNSPSDRLIRRLFQETIFMPNAAYGVLSPTTLPSCFSS